MHRLLMLLLSLVCGTVAARADVPVQPGTSGPLTLAGVKTRTVIYVPPDWAQGKRLPLVLFMFGTGMRPTTRYPRQATGDRGWLVVGLDYLEQGASGKGIKTDATSRMRMVSYIKAVLKWVETHYGHHEGQVFLAGVSMGGWGVNLYGFHPGLRGRFRGYAILAAGAWTKSRGIAFSVTRGLPVLLLNGETDYNRKYADLGARLLKGKGALVEQVVLPGQGHNMGFGDVGRELGRWLRTHRVPRDVARLLARARDAEKRKRPGQAVARIREAVKKAPDEPAVAEALAHAEALEAEGRAALEAAVALAASDREGALKALERLGSIWGTHAIGQAAGARRAALKKQP